MSDLLAHSVFLISAAMFDGLWEGLVIAGVVWLILRALPQLGAATRYAVWLCTLAALVAIPLLTLAFPRPHAAQPAVTYTVVTTVPAATPKGDAQAATATRAGAQTFASPPTPSLIDRAAVSAALPVGAALLWLLVAGVRLVLLALNLLDLAGIRRRATLWSALHDYPVYISRDIDVPLAVGFLRPQVLLPSTLIEEQSSAAIEAIITHEVAHLRRGDVWTNAFARFVEALAALNPAAWFVLRRLSVEREIACDDWVVDRLGAGDIFARALATMASCAGARTPLAAPSAIGSKHSVVTRIEQLLDAHPRRLRLSLSAVGGTLMLFALIAMVLQSISPVLAYAPEQKTVQVANTCVNHGVLYDFSFYTGDTIKHNWEPLPTVAIWNKAVKNAQNRNDVRVVTADVTFDANGKATRVALVSPPNIPGIEAHVKEHFARAAFEPAVSNCEAVATTMRVVVPIQFRTDPNTQSNVTPSYPVGWGAQHASACRVPNLVHDGVPKDADFASLPALSASVRVNVDASGTVTNATLTQPSGHADFDNALLTAARAATYPLDESTGFKPVRPNGAMLSWNNTHGYDVYSKCSPLPTAYVWTAVHRPSRVVTLP